MRVAVATNDGAVAQHFGRCPEYTIVDIEDGVVTERRAVQNPGHAPGVIPEFLKGYDVEAIIAGGMGGRAQTLFDDFGIEHVLGITGTIESVIRRCVDGTLEGGESLCSHTAGDGHGDHHCDHHGDAQ